MVGRQRVCIRRQVRETRGWDIKKVITMTLLESVRLFERICVRTDVRAVNGEEVEAYRPHEGVLNGRRAKGDDQ